jgi:hypothetical protein
MERMAGDVEKREVSTGGNGREAESERLIPRRRIIGTSWSHTQPFLRHFNKLHKITFRLTALSGKMMVFGYLETPNPRH